MAKNIKVLIVDDSAVVRETMTRLLQSAPGIEVIAAAADPYLASQYIAKEVPDVITLDIEMPRMDGLTFLKKIMSQRPIPVVICSSLTAKGSETAITALEIGAVDIICKPQLGVKKVLEEQSEQIIDAVRGAAAANLKQLKTKAPVATIVRALKYSADVVLAARKGRSVVRSTEKVVAIGASTGGTEALRVLLQDLPHDTVGMLVVQHMPEHFTRSFADRLNFLCNVTVKEAEDGDKVLRGQVLLAPGNKHMMLKRNSTGYYVSVKDGELVSRHRPSVDVLFRSMANEAGKNAIGVILTGMGDDGARGLKEMFDAGAYTIGQDKETSVVYGMPNEAFKAGAVTKQLPLGKIASALLHRDRQF
jgi:two-component system chemotaxis response regulator CheB